MTRITPCFASLLATVLTIAAPVGTLLLAQAGRAPGHTTRSAESAGARAPDARIPLSILPIDPTNGDSARVIIARDLDYGDRIQIVWDGNPSQRAVSVLRAVPFSGGLTVALIDPRTGGVRQSSDFPLPVIPAPRDSAVEDSLMRALNTRVAARQAVLARYTVMGDSLRRELSRKAPHFWTSRARNKYRAMVAERDSILRLVMRNDSTVRADAHKDSIATATYAELAAATDRSTRDSAEKERRWALHGIADEVQRWITGQRGVAQSRVTYISKGEIRVVDFDGANDHAVTTGGMALSPSWRHDGRAIVYADMTDTGTQIAFVDLRSGRSTLLGATPRGLNITPVYSPDDRWIFYANGDGPGIQLVATRTDGGAPLRRITGARGYDASSPAFSPDGNRLAFVSPRPTTPQIYSVNLDGSGDKLETPHAGSRRSYRASPDWSPDAKSIAFEQQNGDFQVWQMTLPERKFKKLTSVGENEDPSWAPDARHIALTSNRGGAKAIWVLDTQTGRMRQLTRAGDARLAAWSPTLSSAH